MLYYFTFLHQCLEPGFQTSTRAASSPLRTPARRRANADSSAASEGVSPKRCASWAVAALGNAMHPKGAVSASTGTPRNSEVQQVS